MKNKSINKKISKPAGIFLMAPSIYNDYNSDINLDKINFTGTQLYVIHGLKDKEIDYKHSVKYCREHPNTYLYLLNDDHRLHDSIPKIDSLFSILIQLAKRNR
eukprot:TRINITY_DN16499_c0_g1_i1.p1 TRINITY_DN16499_c0_g1~~TRINITY_DN16499_c0_g1_i1.p1  ORF type:complete len:103 (+),score=21.53 TRINITY_DN16499_c0_g1_i1:319-627(+)